MKVSLVIMQMIREFLQHNSGTMYTSEEIAEQVQLSRITVRRYMNYLTQTHEVVSAIDYRTGGRPSIQYGMDDMPTPWWTRRSAVSPCWSRAAMGSMSPRSPFL